MSDQQKSWRDSLAAPRRLTLIRELSVAFCTKTAKALWNERAVISAQMVTMCVEALLARLVPSGRSR